MPADIIQKWYLIDVLTQKKSLPDSGWGRDESYVNLASYDKVPVARHIQANLTTVWVTKRVLRSLQVGSFEVTFTRFYLSTLAHFLSSFLTITFMSNGRAEWLSSVRGECEYACLQTT